MSITLDILQIQAFLPHRYPFLLVDKIMEITEDKIVGVKNVTMNEPMFQGHFPGNPGVTTLPCKGYSNQVSLLLQPVALGLGFTVVPRYARQAFAAQDKIAVLQCGQPVIDTLWAIYRAEWPLNARCRLVLERIRSTLNQAAASQIQ